MIEYKKFDKSFLKKSKESHSFDDIIPLLETIRNNIKTKGDQALIEYTYKFDKLESKDFSLIVKQKEIDKAYSKVSSDFITSIQLAIKNISQFHENQLPINWDKSTEDGYSYGMQYAAIENAGLYVPGGQALYPSSVIMNAIPAKTAGVSNCVITTPPLPSGDIAPEVLVAAQECNVSTIVKAGGAQAVFALAYGTESIQHVDKIVGPGNKYVDKAKQMVYGRVDIDKPAGPSEVLIYIEDINYLTFAVSELLAQCEHDPDALGIIISSNIDLLKKIPEEINNQIKELKRTTIIKQALKNSHLFSIKDEKEAIDVMNMIASEHLVLMVDHADELKSQIKHAGAIFCGPYTPVACGDYISGPNHVLPTNQSARFSSALSVMDFMKFSSFLNINKQELSSLDKALKCLTDVEKLDAHYKSVKKRLES